MRQIISILTVLLFTAILFGCNLNTEKENDQEVVKEDSTTHPLKQKPEALLAGISKAVCYSGFREGQHPDRGEGANNPTDEQILEDLLIITEAGFKLIRLYDSGENSEAVLRIISENKLDIKVLLGVWLKAELSNHEDCSWLNKPIPQEVLDENKKANLAEIERGISLTNQYSEIVEAVNVGNEALVSWNDHLVSVDSVIAYAKKVKQATNKPITVADNYEWWAESGKELAEVLDFISIHIYPVWEGKDIDEAMSYSIKNIEKVHQALPDAKIVITEAGWATTALEFGERASQEKQKQYYDELMTWCAKMNYTCFFFEAFDEPWKGDPNKPNGAEKHWGLYFVDRTPKLVVND